LRSPMTKDWLNGLEIVCIEKLLDRIDIFVSKNVSRNFVRCCIVQNKFL
jgi:hypothetical protein